MDPVQTVADFSAQAVVNTILANAFPADPIVGTDLDNCTVITSERLTHSPGEEDSADLRVPTAAQLRTHLTSLANDALHLPIRAGDGDTQLAEAAGWGIGPESPIRSTDELLSIIDRGNYEGGSTGRMYSTSSAFRLLMTHRDVGFGSHRWHQRFLARRTVRCVLGAHRRLCRTGRRHGMPKPPCIECQPRR